MTNFRVAFGVNEKYTKMSPGHSYLECHLIFDVKMNFTRKVRFVSNGCTTMITLASTYAGVVSRERVRIEFTYRSLNGLDIMADDIENSYLQAPISEKYWTILGTEFGPEFHVCKAYVVRPVQ